MKTNEERIKELKEEIQIKWDCHMEYCNMESCPSCVKYYEMKAELQAREECQKEFQEKIEKLEHWINNENGSGKYFMSLGIDMLNDKIKEIFGEQK
jgi:hypothetical protein